jgi:hypothetical protein
MKMYFATMIELKSIRMFDASIILTNPDRRQTLFGSGAKR